MSVLRKFIGNMRERDDAEEGWQERFGQKDSVFDLCFEWKKHLNNKMYETVAFSRQQTSWLKITGHGEATIDALPDSIKAASRSAQNRE